MVAAVPGNQMATPRRRYSDNPGCKKIPPNWEKMRCDAARIPVSAAAI
jgi:hypothetical protein